jgi:hypothetical protein
LSFAARFASPSREELDGLRRKYDALADLRKRREAGEGVAPRRELLALAREFPGALRELDTLPLEEIERRRVALAAPRAEEAPEPWMTWMIAYHATMRAALYIKARLAGPRAAHDERTSRDANTPPHDQLASRGQTLAARHEATTKDSELTASDSEHAQREDSRALSTKNSELPDELVQRLIEDAARHTHLPIDDHFVRAVAKPPARRVNAAVFERLGRDFAVEPDAMWQALFPTRRSARF